MGQVSLASIGLLGGVLDELPMGVIVLDAAGHVVLYNRYEERMAFRDRADVIGKDFFVEVAPCMSIESLAGVFRDGIGSSALKSDVDMMIQPPHSSPRDVVVRLRSLSIEGQPFAALYIEDVSLQRAADRTREALSQLLVHDMKNPLAAVLANLEFIHGDGDVDADADAADYAEAISDALQASKRLERMIGQLLDLTRLQTGNLQLRRVAADVGPLVSTVVAAMHAVAKQRSVELGMEPSANPACCDHDRDILERALLNLVDNAIRHSPRGARVVVRAFSESRRVVLQVIDQGSGVPPSERERVFEAYAQLSDEYTLRGMNQGLGLSFVRMAARAHGGDASVRDGPDGGALFEIWIPT